VVKHDRACLLQPGWYASIHSGRGDATAAERSASVIPPTGKRFALARGTGSQVAEQKLVEHWVTREDLPPHCSWGFFALPMRRFPGERIYSPNLVEGVFFRS
jgi:hypothetical protein